MGIQGDLRRVKSLWGEKIQIASKKKHSEFGKYATECEKFYASPTHAFMYDTEGFGMGDGPQVTTNLVFQMVDVFLPFLHHTNPTRMVTDRRPQVPPELEVQLRFPPEQLQQIAQQHDQQQQMMAAQYAQLGQQYQPQPFDPAMLIPQDPQGDAARDVRNFLLESYLNYTPHELGLHNECLQRLTDSLLSGLGV